MEILSHGFRFSSQFEGSSVSACLIVAINPDFALAKTDANPKNRIRGFFSLDKL